MKKHLCRALLALTLALAVTGTTLPTAWAAESEENAPLDCASALLMEAESGRVLFEYNADDRHAPASITKIMTMLLAMEALERGEETLDTMITGSEYACSMGGTQIWLEPGEQFTLDELVKARFVEMFGDFKINTKNWPVASFDEIAIIDGNMTTDYKKYANYPHIGIDSIEKETGALTGYRTVAEDGVISGKYLFTPKHIIYSKIRPNLNKVALPNFNGLCSADAYPILPIEGKCNRIFLAYDMRSQFFLDYILQFCNRTNLPKVNRKEVSGFKTPLPPIELQNKFATFVEQTDKSKLTIQQSLDKLEMLKKALMQQYFG